MLWPIGFLLHLRTVFLAVFFQCYLLVKFCCQCSEPTRLFQVFRKEKISISSCYSQAGGPQSGIFIISLKQIARITRPHLLDFFIEIQLKV